MLIFIKNVQYNTVMTLLKTKTKLIDVARKLFAKKGFDDTTMNDIAVASKVGRRTLYTYFKSKEEIYSVVIETELNRLTESMMKIVQKPIAPDLKILELIENHLEAVKAAVFRNGTLRADFFRDIWRVETVRKEFDRKQISLYRTILSEGQEKGIFTIENLNLAADILYYCVKGIEVPYIRGQVLDENGQRADKTYIAKIINGALGKKG